jgi:hypothetical protein
MSASFRRYWGFNTQQEWDAYEEALRRKYEDELYADLIRYAKGEPNGIGPGTYPQAEIAKEFIAREPALGDPAMRDSLMARVNESFEAEHVIKVQLDHSTTQQLEDWFARTADPYGRSGKQDA